MAVVGNLRQQRIEQFLDLKDLAPKTRKTYAQQLLWFSDWVDKDWQTIHLNDVRRYKLHLEQERQLKPNSIALALSSLKSFYAWLKLAGYVVDNPMMAVSVPRPAAAESQNLEGFQVDALVGLVEAKLSPSAITPKSYIEQGFQPGLFFAKFSRILEILNNLERNHVVSGSVFFLLHLVTASLQSPQVDQQDIVLAFHTAVGAAVYRLRDRLIFMKLAHLINHFRELKTSSTFSYSITLQRYKPISNDLV